MFYVLQSDDKDDSDSDYDPKQDVAVTEFSQSESEFEADNHITQLIPNISKNKKLLRIIEIEFESKRQAGTVKIYSSMKEEPDINVVVMEEFPMKVKGNMQKIDTSDDFSKEPRLDLHKQLDNHSDILGHFLSNVQPQSIA